MIKATERKQNPLQPLLQHNKAKEIHDQINKRKFETDISKTDPKIEKQKN